MKLYPEGYDVTKTMTEEQRGQYVEQKEVNAHELHIKIAKLLNLASIDLSNDDGKTA